MPGLAPRNTDDCPILRPSKAQFNKPFLTFVSDYFKQHPEVPVIKVVPPKGYTPRQSPYDLDDTVIEVPIEQRVLMHDNKPGYYDCVLLSRPSMTVKEFKDVAAARGLPKQGHEGDDLLERAFWSSLTVRPPLYGADTPHSLFDEEVQSGWNLRKLGCLLHKHDVPAIPGVTTPMTYFGMWKSFFSWHVEDVDLLSINYLHLGAPKVWYAVAPGKDRRRFEELAKGLFPKDAAKCANFLRHKTIMITPKMLQKHGIPYVKVKHNPGEFIVLNAGAYHAGYNQGFNCAEAVNFATQDWIPLGKEATRCDCKALGKDAVRVDMRVFPGGADTSSDEESSSDSASEGDSRTSDADSLEDEVSSTQTKKKARKPVKAKARQPQNNGAKAEVAKRGPGRPRKHPPMSDKLHDTNASAAGKATGKVQKASQDEASIREQRQAARKARHDTADQVQARHGRPAAQPAEGNRAEQRQPHNGRRRSVADDAGTAAGVGQDRSVGRGQRGESTGVSVGREPQASADQNNERLVNKKRKMRADQEDEAQDSGEAELGSPHKKAKRPVGRPRAQPALARPHSASAEAQKSGQGGAMHGPRPTSGRGIRPDADGKIRVVGKPYVIVGRDEDHDNMKFFYMVEKLDEPAKKPQEVRIRWLEQGSDGLYYPTDTSFDESPAALMEVRTQECVNSQGRRGVRLLTLKSKILEADLCE